MIKFALRVLVLAVVFLLMSFSVIGRDESPDTQGKPLVAENGHAEPLRYLLLGDPPEAMDVVDCFRRRHSGWPMWALYVDTGRQEAETRAWRARLDTYRLAGNFALYCIVGLVFSMVLTVRKRRLDATVAPPASTPGP